MWGGGGSGGGGGVGAKSTMIKGEDITIKWLHWSMAAETNYAVQKRVWSLVADRRVMETKKIGTNGMDYFVFLSR